MLKLDDRLRIAMVANMGVQLSSQDVVKVAGWLIALMRISENTGGAPARQAKAALGEFAPVK